MPNFSGSDSDSYAHVKSERILASALLALFLTGCGGPATAVTPNASQQNIRTIKHTTSSCPCLYVANYAAVTAYASGANGNAKPILDISGSATGWRYYLGGVAVDGSGTIYVTAYSQSTVSVFSAGSNGNVAPTQVIGGSYTGLTNPEGIAVDPVNGDIYVANNGNNNGITIYAAGADGNVPPIATIGGSYTGLQQPTGVALDENRNVYVADGYNNRVSVFAAGSFGNVPPLRTIAGSKTKLYGIGQIAVDSNANIYVTNSNVVDNIKYITVYAPGANGNVRPIRTIKGSSTKLAGPSGVALDTAGDVYVANSGNSSVTAYTNGSTGNVPPIIRIKGSKTALSNIWQIAIH